VMKSFIKDNDGYAYFVVGHRHLHSVCRSDPLSWPSESLHVSVPELDALVGSQFGGFLPRRNKVCSADDISLPRVERKGNVCAKREKMSMAHYRVDHFYTQNEQKSSYAERCIKTLKSKLFRYLSRHQTHRWIDVLDEITQSYNGSYRRSATLLAFRVIARLCSGTRRPYRFSVWWVFYLDGIKSAARTTFPCLESSVRETCARSGKRCRWPLQSNVPVVIFDKRFHHGIIGIPLVVDERGDHFASPEFSVDLTVQTECFLCRPREWTTSTHRTNRRVPTP
jgi:hypothetical protein